MELVQESAISKYKGKLVEVVANHEQGYTEAVKMMCAGRMNGDYIFIRAIQNNDDGTKSAVGMSAPIVFYENNKFILNFPKGIPWHHELKIKEKDIEGILKLWGARKQ